MHYYSFFIVTKKLKEIVYHSCQGEKRISKKKKTRNIFKNHLLTVLKYAVLQTNEQFQKLGTCTFQEYLYVSPSHEY